MHAKEVIEKFGGQSALARRLGKGQSTVGYWAKTVLLRSKGEKNWIFFADKGIQILEITTTINGHNINHDQVLGFLKSILK